MDVLLSVLSPALTAAGLAVAVDGRNHGKRGADYQEWAFKLAHPDAPTPAPAPPVRKVVRPVRAGLRAAGSGAGVDDRGEPTTARDTWSGPAGGCC